MRNKRKKHFFRIEAKKFCFRFTSFRFEAKMTAHPTQNQDENAAVEISRIFLSLFPEFSVAQ
jgi:hypothetical protein